MSSKPGPAVWQQCQLSSRAGEAAVKPTVVLVQVAGLCLPKMHFLLPTTSRGGGVQDEEVTVPQKGKCTAVSRSFP